MRSLEHADCRPVAHWSPTDRSIDTGSTETGCTSELSYRPAACHHGSAQRTSIKSSRGRIPERHRRLSRRHVLSMPGFCSQNAYILALTIAAHVSSNAVEERRLGISMDHQTVQSQLRQLVLRRTIKVGRVSVVRQAVLRDWPQQPIIDSIDGIDPENGGGGIARAATLQRGVPVAKRPECHHDALVFVPAAGEASERANARAIQLTQSRSDMKSSLDCAFSAMPLLTDAGVRSVLRVVQAVP